MLTVVRVISLPDARDRRSRFAQNAPPVREVDWSFFEAGALTTEGIAYSPEQAIVRQGRELRRGEIGCFVSHYRLWNELLETAHEQMLVLEDDVFVDWSVVRPLLETRFPSGIDYLRLYAKRAAPAREIGWFRGRRLVQYLHYCYGTQAYLLTRAGAKKLIGAAKAISRPIDDFIDRSWDHGIPNLAMVPFPVLELGGVSSIGGAERHRSPVLSPVDKLLRIGYRTSDKIRRIQYAARECSPMATVRLEGLCGVTSRNVPQEPLARPHQGSSSHDVTSFKTMA